MLRRILPFAALLVLGTLPGTASVALGASTPSGSRAEQAAALSATLDEVRTAALHGQAPVLVFDVDGAVLKAGGAAGFVSGATDYVRQALQAGAVVVYATARPEAKAAAALAADGFPVDGKKALVASKAGLASGEIDKVGRPLAFFEGDAKAAQALHRARPEAEVFEVNVAGAAPVAIGANGVRVIDDYAGEPTAAELWWKHYFVAG